MITLEQFEDEWIGDITKDNPNSITKGNRFVEKILKQGLEIESSSADIIYCDGAGDGGIDAAVFVKGDSAEGIDGDAWIIVQGKFGSSYSGSDTLFNETQKFFASIEGKRENLSTISSDLIQRIRTFLQNKGPKDRFEYILATCRSLSNEEKEYLNNVNILGKSKFGDCFYAESISIETIYNRIKDFEPEVESRIEIPLTTSVASADDTLYIGATRLKEVYNFMQRYKDKTGDLDLLYEKNVRKFLGSKRKVNKGIDATIENYPERFGLYNNGITIVAEVVKKDGIDSLKLTNPYIVNGCQTTKSIWGSLQRKLNAGGTSPSAAHQEWEKRLENAVVITKIVSVGSAGEELLTETTRFTNSQNAVGEKDFIALEKDFKNWAPAFAAKYGVFLEIQRGAWEAKKAHQKQNPTSTPQYTESANAFDLMKAYAAAFLTEPGVAYGKNPPFAPGGTIFNKIINDGEFGVDRLYSAYCLLNLAASYSFGRGATKATRGQTRYLFILTTYTLIRDFLINNDLPYTASEISSAINKFAASGAIKDFGEAAVMMIDEYMTQGGDETIYTEPEFKKLMDLNICLKSDKLGKNDDAFPNYKMQLSSARRDFKRHADIPNLISIVRAN